MSPWLSDLLLRTQTDERLAALARLGHQRAFETIVERYRLPLHAYAQRISPNRADDLVQQTFLAALSALQADTEVRHLRGWLYQIMRHLAWRENASWPALGELDDDAPVTESAEQVAERRMLALDALAEVAQLPTRQHEALIQTALQGRSRTEVAAAMGLSEGAVRQLVHRARASVRAAVTAIIPFPLMRWLAGARSSAAASVSEATLGAGTASGAGIALKLGVGALVASGAVATGVISTAPRAHTPRARLSAERSGNSRAILAGAVHAPIGPVPGTLLAARNGGALMGSSGHRSESSRTVRRSSAGRSAPSAGTTSSGQFAGGGSRRPTGAPSGPGSGTNTHGGSDGNGGSGGSDGGRQSHSGSGSTGDGSSGSSSGGGGSDGGSSGSGTSGSDGGSSGGTSGSSGSGGGGSGGPDGGSSGSTTSGSDGSGSTPATSGDGSGSASSGSTSGSGGDGSGSSSGDAPSGSASGAGSGSGDTQSGGSGS